MRRGGTHYIVGGHTARDTILTRLAAVPGQAPSARWYHLPRDLPDAWFDQMTSERRDPATGKWEKVTSGARNECPDIAAYLWAIAHLPTTFRLGQRSDRDWARDEAALQPMQGDLFAPSETSRPVPAPQPLAPAPLSADTPPPVPQTGGRRQRGRGWVGGWK
jgi:phage terminase large subunit GpA-like protein